MPTKIAWTNETYNPIVGCSKVSEGCLNCYAEQMAASGRLQQFEQYRKVITNGKWNGKTALVPHILGQPLHWRMPKMIFVSSMGDLFHESVPFEWIVKVMDITQRCPQHIFQLLTKRPNRMIDFFGGTSGAGLNYPPLPNVWLGVTCENQKCSDERIPVLLQIPAAVRFLSLEPLLEDIDFNLIERPNHFHSTPYGWLKYFGKQIHWTIIGCESGPNHRPCKLEWVRNIVAQCRAAGVAVFVKQLSISNKVIHDIEQFPEDLQIREYPEVQSD